MEESDTGAGVSGIGVAGAVEAGASDAGMASESGVAFDEADAPVG